MLAQPQIRRKKVLPVPPPATAPQAATPALAHIHQMVFRAQKLNLELVQWILVPQTFDFRISRNSPNSERRVPKSLRGSLLPGPQVGIRGSYQSLPPTITHTHTDARARARRRTDLTDAWFRSLLLLHMDNSLQREFSTCKTNQKKRTCAHLPSPLLGIQTPRPRAL